MATKTTTNASRSASQPREQSRQESMITLPMVHLEVSPEHLAYAAALGVLTALEVIEWPLAAVMIGGQILATRAHRRIVRELAAGVEEAV